MKKIILSFIAIFGISLISFSQSETMGYHVNDFAGDFNLKNIDGKMVSMKDYKDAAGFIVIFTCNHCPFSVEYEDRIIALHNKFAKKGFPVIAINSNDANAYPADSYKEMIIRAKEKKFPYVYLYDETQRVAKMYGAVKTPHVFILRKMKDQFVVSYIGAIDDNADEPKKVTINYVENAVNSISKGEEIKPAFTKAIGCSIKWKK